MTQHRQDTPTHRCKLPEDVEDVVGYFIETGACVPFRRALKRVTMMSASHPFTRYYVNSISSLRHEQLIHLIKYYHIIHPYSMWNFWYRLVQSVNIIFSCIFFGTAQPYFSQSTMIKTMALPNILLSTFFIFGFITGYYNKEEKRVIMSPRKVVVKYLTTYFIFDVLALAPFLYKVLVLFGSTRISGIITVKVMEVIMPLFKFSRFQYILSTADELRLYCGWNHYVLRAFKIVLSFVFFLLFANMVVYFLVDLYPILHKEFVDCMRTTLGTILMVNSGWSTSSSDLIAERIYPIVLILLGFVLHLALFSNIMQIWYQFYSTETTQRSVYYAVNAFMAQKALPEEMRQRIQLYLDFKYQKNFYKQTAIERVTSETLRQEIIVSISKNNVDKVEFFHKIPEKLMHQIRVSLKNEIYLPNDTIVRAGSMGTCMFFILAGTVAVTTPDGQLVCFLRDGAYFGEIALISHVPRVANVVAASPIEVFKLNKKHFLAVLEQFPALMKEVSELAMRRAATTQLVSDLHQETSMDILDQSSRPGRGVPERSKIALEHKKT